MHKYILIALLFVGISGLIGVILYPTFGENIENLQPVHASATGKALTREEAYLKQVQDMEQKKETESMFYNLAQKGDNIRLCSSITDTVLATDCRDQFTIRKAVTTNNPATCETLIGTTIVQKCEDEVFYTLSLSVGDAKLCERIIDSDRKNTCIEEVSQILYRNMTSSGTLTETSCDTLMGTAKEACVREFQKQKDGRIYELAIKTEDITLCKNIYDNEILSLCQDTIRLKLSLTEENNDLCRSIDDEKKKSLCEKQLMRSSMINIYKMVLSSHDIDLCIKITDTKLSRQCHDTILLEKIHTTKDTLLCKNLFATGSISACQKMILDTPPLSSSGTEVEPTSPQ